MAESRGHATTCTGSRRTHEAATSGQRLSDELDRWLNSDGKRTLGTLIEAVRQKSFAVLFVVLLGVPALPLPTGATHLFEAIAMLLALQLMIGRDEIWLPRRWRDVSFGGDKRVRFIARLIKMIRWLERRSRPRARLLFDRRATNVVFGALVLAGTVAAFVAPRSRCSTRFRRSAWSYFRSACLSTTP